MKKSNVLLTAALLVASHQAAALINDGKYGPTSELFISVYDAVNNKSYYKDLGITVSDFLAGTGCVAGDFSADPNFAPIKNAAGLKYNIAGVMPLLADNTNITEWGYVATGSAAGTFSAKWRDIDNAVQKIQSYIGLLNAPLPFTNAAGQAEINSSALFTALDQGFYNGGAWGSTMGSSVSGSTEGSTGQPVDFYVVRNSTGEDAGGLATKLGSWTLSAGKLSYSGTGTATICGSGSNGGGNTGGGNTGGNTGGGGTVTPPVVNPFEPGKTWVKPTVSTTKAAVKQTVRVGWEFSNIVPKGRTVVVKYAKSGAYRVMKTLKARGTTGVVNLKFAKKDISAAGKLQVCVKKLKSQPEVCSPATTISVQ
jgi:hypothetical protein